ncbi:T-cell immunoglobulin and mucin domain-containing protein 4-like [Acanthopagrus latus]|uniref:T-cell immunoglobulin and mucin domain-containing protein 4-like n=1 Tax=Acanthopagrus latus TaxID=8177 RepID=UPI00187D0AFE|nr:T-cell immunoglobulin and mucin domain-containing protein 4-like [Acanthopagrus latus]
MVIQYPKYVCGLCYFFFSILTQVSSSTLKVTGFYGDNVTLSCRYDTQTQSVYFLHFCWGRDKVPISKCSKTILSFEEGAVSYRKSPRYKLLGRLADGDVSLTIVNAQWSDAGVYGCRVEIPGWFNDQKVNVQLVMEEAPTEHPVTEDWTLRTQDVLTTSAPQNEEGDDARLDLIGNLLDETTEEAPRVNEVKTYSVFTFEEKFKASLGVGDIGRAAAIFLLTIIVILVFIFRRGFLPGRKLQELNISADENIYESVPNHN